MSTDNFEEFKKFNEKFFNGVKHSKDIKWFDRMGIMKLDDKRNAEIILATSGTHAHYEGYLVKIINKVCGEIVNHYFHFDKYLSITDRIDARRDYTKGYEVITYVKIDWYIAIPSDKNRIAMGNKIIEYILNYK